MEINGCIKVFRVNISIRSSYPRNREKIILLSCPDTTANHSTTLIVSIILRAICFVNEDANTPQRGETIKAREWSIWDISTM